MALRLSDRIIQIGVFTSLGLLGIGAGLFWLARQPCPNPKRPRGVPPAAAWVGDCNSGSWVEIDAASAGRYQVSIFHQAFGDKIKEGWFRLSDDCDSKDLTPGQLLERLSRYEGETFTVVGALVGDKCRLVPAK